MASRHSVADYSPDLAVRRPARLNAMTDAERREIAETLFERTHEEIRDAIKLEDERRAALVKNLYRLRALRLARDRVSMRIQGG